VERVGNKREDYLLSYAVLRRTEGSHGDFAILRTGILRNPLAVVDTVNIHLSATVGTVEKPGQRCGLAPAVRVSAGVGADPLDIIIHFLRDNRLVGVLEDCPLAFINIVTFLVLKMLLRLEIDRMA